MKLTVAIIPLLYVLFTAAYSQGTLYPTPRNEQLSPPTHPQAAPASPPTGQSANVAPIVEVELSETEVLVGQPIRLQIKVLVPTYMPQPPIYPTFELPDLMVWLPDRATTPTSERRDGTAFSGTIRIYRLYPLAAGSFQIPQQTLSLTYADPDTNAPVKTEAAMPAQSFTATVPVAAQGLKPPVIAADFTLEQEIQGETDLGVGDAVTRIVTARIDGTTPVLIPALVPAIDTTTLRAYPKEPRVTSSQERGELSGARRETVTYLVQSDGAAELPAIRIEWYDTKSRSIRTAAVEGVSLTLAPAPPPPPDYRKIGLWGTVAMGGLGLVWLMLLRLSPGISQTWENALIWGRSTEFAAARSVRRSIGRNDLNATYAAIAAWSVHSSTLTPSDWSEFRNALLAIGSNIYGERSKEAQADWRFLAQSFKKLRKSNRNSYLTLNKQRFLPRLNSN